MSALADLIDVEREALLAAWGTRVREHAQIEDADVRGFMPRFLREVASALRANVAPIGSPAAQEHAQQRRGLAIGQEAITREYVALRELVLHAAGASIGTGDLRLLDDCILVGITETATVLALDALKDTLAQADMGRMLARQREAEQHALAAQKQAQTSEAQLRTIADALPVLVSWVDADERYAFVNRTYERWFGRAREDVVGRPAVEIIGAEAYAVMQKHIHRALAGETFSFEQRAVPYPDRTRDIRASFAPQRDATGHIDGFVVLMEELSR